MNGIVQCEVCFLRIWAGRVQNAQARGKTPRYCSTTCRQTADKRKQRAKAKAKARAFAQLDAAKG